MYSSNNGITCLAAPAEVLSRKVPLGADWLFPACSSATRIVERAGVMVLTNSAPISDSDTLRVVRLNKRTPIRASSAAIEWLSADVETFSSVAAARKLRCRATASTASNSFNPEVFIVLSCSSSHADLYGLSGQ